jgi:lipid-A-disaccharide synthase
MEPAIYARHGVDARFVGHPLASIFAMTPDRSAARAQLGLSDHTPVLALLPGSRLSEIARLGRDFVDAAILLQREFPDLQVVAPMANAACHAAFEQLVRDSRLGTRDSVARTIKILSPDSRLPNPESRLSPSHTAMIAADAVLLASGTAALEAMLAKSAMVVAYRVAPVTYFLVKALRLLRTSVYSLPNILAGKTIVPELMQDACTPVALAAALAPVLRARALDPATLAEFVRLHESLRGDQQHNAAAAILELLALRDAVRTH